MKLAITLLSILGLAVAVVADPQINHSSAQANSITFLRLLSPTDSVLMTDAEFRCFSGNKIFFENDNGYQSFHAADLKADVLAALHITAAQLETQQKNLDAANQRAREQAAALALFGNPQIGRPAPSFTATDIFGKTVSLNDYKGKIVVLESFTSVELGVVCEFCEAHYRSGAMQELQKELTTNGVVWLLIDFHPADARLTPAFARQEWTDQKMAITDYIIDTDGSQIGRRYGIGTVPKAMVIDKNGNLAYEGAFDNFATYCGPGTAVSRMTVPARENAIFSIDPRLLRNYVREAVLALLAGKPVAVPETKTLGCPVAYLHFN